MTDRLHRLPAGSSPLRRFGARLTRFLGVWGWTWLLTALGGGACGLVCAGFVSIVVFFFTVPAGLYGGVLLGAPLGLILAIVFRCWADPPADPARFSDRVQVLGAALALVAVAVTNIHFFGGLVGWSIERDRRYAALALLQVANTALSLGVAEIIGRECGFRLAGRYLRRLDLPIPTRRRLWSSRLRPRPRLVRVDGRRS
jgi:hypothetical protein